MQQAEIERLITTDPAAAATAARELLDAADTPAEKARALYLLGRLAWKDGDRAGAIGYYNKAVALDPQSDAAIALEQLTGIMDFYNKDLYNP